MFSRYYYELRFLRESLTDVTSTFIKRYAKELHSYECVCILFIINYHAYIHCRQREQRIILKPSLQQIAFITIIPTMYNDAGYFARYKCYEIVFFYKKCFHIFSFYEFM